MKSDIFINEDLDIKDKNQTFIFESNFNKNKNLIKDETYSNKSFNFFQNVFSKSFFNNNIIFLFLMLFILNLFANACSLQINNNNKNKYNLIKQLKTNIIDNASWSQGLEAVQTKLDFDIYIDMKKRVIDGFVRFHYKCLKEDVKYIALDINNLNIKKVLSSDKKEVKFSIKKNNENSIGDALIIIPEEVCKVNNKNIKKKENQNDEESNNFVDIYYNTLPRSMGLHFSDPNTLYDKRYTFLYTHGEAIYSRTYFPSQDTPSLKVKMTAKILIDDPYRVLFSGKLISKKTFEKEKKTEFYFEMDKPIPTYLTTFIAGKLVKKEIANSRCEVYGEEEALKYVNESFEYCEKYIQFYEKYKKFVWEKMTFLITPDDFPFSGMENPYATILTESVLSKDRSYTSTLSHEIAHFWSGNLVSNKNWKSFWLNEGITTYLTRKSYRKIHGEDDFAFEMYNGLFKLSHAIEELKNPKFDPSQRSLTPLIKDDPYKSFSRIPYEKGSFFLYYLETLIGEETFDKILANYFNEFAYKSIDSDEFIVFIKDGIKNHNKNSSENLTGEDLIKKIQWDEWLKGTDKLPVQFEFKSQKLDKFKEKVDKIKNGNLKLEEFKAMLISMKLNERGRIFKELIDKFYKLNEKTKTLLKNIVNGEHDEIFDIHKTNKADKIILKALFIDNAKERINYLRKTLNEFSFYKVAYMRKVFGLIDEKKSDTKLLKGILKSIAYKLNPITIARINEFIDS